MIELSYKASIVKRISRPRSCSLCSPTTTIVCHVSHIVGPPGLLDIIGLSELRSKEKQSYSLSLSLSLPLPLSPGNLLVTLSCTAVPQQHIQQSVSTCWLTFPSCLSLASPDPQGSRLHCVSPGLCYWLPQPCPAFSRVPRPPSHSHYRSSTPCLVWRIRN